MGCLQIRFLVSCSDLDRMAESEGSFYQKRAIRVAADHHVIIGRHAEAGHQQLLNDLSAFSYKARVKGCKDVSVIYAYDLEAMEPVCAEVFPGNSIDAVSYRSFIVG